jgi:hypothetical protein
MTKTCLIDLTVYGVLKKNQLLNLMIYHQCHERHFPGIHIQYTPFLALTCLPPFLWKYIDTKLMFHKYIDTKLMFHSQALIINTVEHMAILVGRYAVKY